MELFHGFLLFVVGFLIGDVLATRRYRNKLRARMSDVKVIPFEILRDLRIHKKAK